MIQFISDIGLFLAIRILKGNKVFFNIKIDLDAKHSSSLKLFYDEISAKKGNPCFFFASDI